MVRRAVVFGASEGVSLAILFAATYPERTLGLVAYGGFACRRRTPDYPWAPSDEASARLMELVLRSWGGPMELDTLTPSRANDGRFVTRFASYLRQSASPGAAAALLRYNADVDSRAALGHVAAPTLVLHRTADRDAKIDEGRFIARHIAGAQFVELPGADHWPFVGDSAALLGEVQPVPGAAPLATAAGGPADAETATQASGDVHPHLPPAADPGAARPGPVEPGDRAGDHS